MRAPDATSFVTSLPTAPRTTGKRPVSLRRRLLGLMFLAFVVLVSINATLLWGYARGAADRSFDLLLTGAALSILERVSVESEGLFVDIPYSALEIVGLAKNDRVFYAVNAQGQGLLTGTAGLPLPERYELSSEPVFYDAPFEGTTLRFLVQSRRIQTPSGQQWIAVQIGQTRLSRDTQASELFVNGVSGLAFLSLIGLIFVWFAIRYALKPLAAIETNLRSREPGDFSPLALDPPREVGSLIASINSYMARLENVRSHSETFIADVAHQTRTSLAALQGQVGLASDAKNESELRDRLQRVEQQADKVIRLTNQLLAQAMVTHRADHEPLRSLRLETLARNVLSDMFRDTSLRDIEVTFDTSINREQGDMIKGDPVSLSEAVRNLIENAVRHGPVKNQIDVCITAGGDSVELSVSDAGPGIPEEHSNSVLKRFHSLNRETAGSGLGLSIVKQVATSHHADLSLTRSHHGGLRVNLRFPAALCLVIMAGLFTPGSDASAQEHLLVWSATDTSAMQPVVDEFENVNPGISVDYREFQTVELHRRFLENSTMPDVVISSAMDLQFDLVNRGLAQRVDVPSSAPDWGAWRSELFGFTFEPAVLVFATSTFDAADLPHTHRDLATFLRERQVDLDGRIGTYNVRQSGVGYLYATQDAAQGQEALRIAEALGRTNVKTFCCSSQMLDGIAAGRLDIAYNVIGSYALAAAKRDPRIGVFLFDDYNLVMSRTAFVSRNAPNVAAARKFVSYLLSSAGQEAIATAPALLSMMHGAVTISAAVDDSSPNNEPSFLPIRLSAGLLTYLDTMKRERFLENWDGSLAMDVP